jgi:hypothetical protein
LKLREHENYEHRAHERQALCRIVLREILGALVAQNTPIKFDEPIALRDLHAAIQDLTGVRGWSLLLKKAGHG